LGQLPGELANNSAFLVATRLAAVLYGEIEVVNNSPPLSTSEISVLQAHSAIAILLDATCVLPEFQLSKTVRGVLASRI